LSARYALATDAGLLRENNEDSVRAIPELGLYVIADGMGGHVAGEVASRVAADTLATMVANQPEPRRVRDQIEILEQAIHEANNAVLREAKERGLAGMGTTLTGLRITRRTATVTHVGDTRAYFVKTRKLDPLTTDHTLVAMLISTGVLKADQAMDHPDKHLLTQAIGTHAEIEPDVFQRRIPRGCRILLCTDGLHDVVREDKIHELARLPTLEESAQALIDAANAEGGPDNVSVLLVEPG
jgi:protein phosphatase